MSSELTASESTSNSLISSSHQLPHTQPADQGLEGLSGEEFQRDARALLARSAHYVAVALVEGEVVTHWCVDDGCVDDGCVGDGGVGEHEHMNEHKIIEQRGLADQHRGPHSVSINQMNTLLPALNLLIQTTPDLTVPELSGATEVQPARVSYTYTYQGSAQALYAQTYEESAVVLITSTQSSSERAHFWLGSHYKALVRYHLAPRATT